jgi:uncharacterized protein (TIGR03435 family)
MRTLSWTLALVFVSVAWGQKAPAARKLEFEVATIKPSGPLVPGQLGIGVHIDGSQVRARGFTLKTYLGYAYNLKPYQITGPDWITSDRFDITAKLPDGGKSQQVPDMMQSLLEKRFQMKIHREKKPFPVYALVVGKAGLKMHALPPQPGDDEEDSATPDVAVGGGRGALSMNLGHGSSISLGGNKVQGKRISMPDLAAWLSRLADRPVIDMSELKGRYDLTLQFTPDDYRSLMIHAASSAGINIPLGAPAQDDSSMGALQSALQTVGLRIEPRKSPLDMLIVDHAEKTPTSN